MIVISRETGEVIREDLTQQQKEDLAFSVFRAFCQLHEDDIRQAVAQYQQAQ